MSAKTHLPALIALQMTMAALLLGTAGSGIGTRESSRHDQAQQGIAWNAGIGCVALHGIGEMARSRPAQPLTAIGSGCVKFR